MCAQIVAVSCGLYFKTFFKNEFSLSRSDKKKNGPKFCIRIYMAMANRGVSWTHKTKYYLPYYNIKK